MTPFLQVFLSAGIVPAAVAAGAACHPIDSEKILVRDVAPIVPGFARLPQDFLVGYVEPSGAPRTFRATELEQIAKNRGVDLKGLEDLCLERRTFIVPAELIEAAMRKSLGENAKIEISDSDMHPVPTGELYFPRSGVQPGGGPEITWRGYVRSPANSTYPVWARARITERLNRVMAVADLPAGKQIQSSQIRLETVEDSPFDNTLARALDEVAGFLPKTPIMKGSAILKLQVALPLDVSRGDLVRVEVYSGNAHLSMEARAETSGMKGALITVRNLSSGRDFQATVAGKGQATVGGKTE